MTQQNMRKFVVLKATTERFAPKVAKKTASPFASSAAKYYPALKSLASK